MRYYTVALIHVHSSDWVAAYARAVTTLVESAGGRYLARSSSAELLEGDDARPSVLVIIEWPSRQLAEDFYHSSQYAEFLHARLKGSRGCNWLVPGEDIAGLAALLPPGCH